ncbi:major facilitator superfamily domain-containing protein, partial [Peziza echinospora]
GFEELLYTAEQERRVVRKMDKYLVGFLAVLYMLSFLDRSNIGNARIAGLTEDLNLTGDQYEWLLTAFYTTYITFEWMTLLWKVIPAHKYIAICVAGWGTIACLQALTTSFTSLFILRLLLGVLEAAFSPGIPFYLSFFYRREELALRIGLIVAAAPLANAYSGSLAWVITSLKTPLAPWRLLLIAEGFPGLVLAVVAWYWFPDGPEDQWWLTARERGIARRRVLVVRGGEEEEDDEGLGDEEGDGIGKGVRWREVWSALVDGKNWITAMIFFSCNVSFASLPVFLPTIINDMGYTSITTQLLTFPPYLLSFLLVILTTLLSDRHLTRSPFILLHAATAFLGYLFLSLPPAYLNPPLWLRYLAIYPICVGVFSCVALVIPWTINNQKTATGRGTGMVLMGMVGQLGPLVGVRLFPKREAPGYEVGMGWCAMAMVVVMGLTGGLRWVLVRENGKRGGRGGSGGAEGFRYIL